MIVGKLKKDVRKAAKELLEEGFLTELLSKGLQYIIENSNVSYDVHTNKVSLQFKKTRRF